MFYGVQDIERREFRYVSAGNAGAVHLANTHETHILSAGKCAIGWFRDTVYEETVVPLEPGDRFYIFSDGVANASNPNGDAYKDRLAATIHDGRDQPFETSLNQLVYDVRDWYADRPPDDDICILGFEIC